MLHSLFPVLTCLMSAAGEPLGADAIPRGISSHSVIVQRAGADSLTVSKTDDYGFRTHSFTLRIAKESQFELVRPTTVDGKPTFSMRSLRPQELFATQPLSVIVYSDGKDLTVLRAVAFGGDFALGQFVRKHGGTFRRQTWPKDHVSYLVNLSGADLGEADLRELGALPAITELDLSFTATTDEGLANLAAYRKLGTLNLIGTRITDAAVPTLVRLPDLSQLLVAQTALTDAALKELIEKKPDLRLCTVASGDKARFRVFRQHAKGSVQYTFLMINDTYYGHYTPERKREATTYYHRLGPVGQIMGKLEWFPPASELDYPSDVRMPASLVCLLTPAGSMPSSALCNLWSEPPFAVVRLNAGTHAAYGRPLQPIHFYNSSPELVEFSMPRRGEPAFGFIREAMSRGCDVRIIAGAERTAIAKQAPRNFYRAMFVDVTRNDLRDINTALLTKEAIAEMMSCLTEDGTLCFHVSHRYYDLIPPIVDAAASLSLSWKSVQDMSTSSSKDRTHFSSTWVVLARKPAHLRHLTSIKQGERSLEWSVPPSTGRHLWRDGQAPNLNPLSYALKNLFR